MVEPLEEEEQKAFIDWLDLNGIPYFAVPNSQKLTGLISGKRLMLYRSKLKKEGFKKGVPDLAVFLPSRFAMIEMKRRKGGSATKEQKEWVALIDSMPYASSKICKGAEEAIKFIQNLLKEDENNANNEKAT